MAVAGDRTRPGDYPRASHPFHAAVLAGAFPLFLGALIADYASWLLVGAMVLVSIALLCEVIALFRGYRNWIPLLVVAATWIVGFFDALHHGRDAWAIMPGALWYSLIVSILSLVATWLAFSGLRAGGAR